MIERKGLHILLKAVSIQSSALQVDIVGSLDSEPDYARRMREFITAHDLSSFVFLHGPLDNEPLIEKLRQAQVLVIPSSYEGFGIAYLEGMCFGLPAVGTTAGAAGEIITEGVDGFLIGPEDVKLLASRLRLLNERRDVLTRMSLEARRRYLRQPKWEQSAGEIREFLLKRIAAFTV